MKTILLLEDQLLLREIWKLMLEGSNDFKIVAEASDSETARQQLETLRPDILLTDIFLLNETALALVASVKSLSPGTKTIVLSSAEDAAFVELLMQHGACAYLTKNCSKKELLEALAASQKNQVYLSSDARVAMFYSQKLAVPVNKSEFKTLCLLARKITNAQIAKILKRSIKTIEAINTNLYKKTGAKTREELISIAQRNALNIEDEFIIARNSIYC